MQGQLKKMSGQLASPILYDLPLNDTKIPLNPFIGQPIKLTNTGKILCLHCGKAIKKTYNQGYCYPCFISLAECDLCIVKPHTCHYAAGTCREPSWGEAFCFQPHIVYLANSSGIKVGITRATQIPTRWIDQGASQALAIFQTSSRQIAGLVEMVLAQHISDKTNWQQMLKKTAEPIDLPERRDQLLDVCASELTAISERFGVGAVEPLRGDVVELAFPVSQYPTKIKSLCLIKTPEISGTLLGIKGQYLLLDSGVLNIRKYTGYEVNFQA
ncbi:DUF2797 domain-containing protein [Methylovulum psychrotolerans]|uniref:DUF2797 domain-containing protein n=1 Tax=Methylovulum psychrotolerans TaxID=1704499 RepID=UPI001BFF6414|nr:DUF2797 domain-containing protein [Methylovulum psychrotolerans]MBT9096543.1 DUF2797 domain-containing protein [Methylovulum psychrotolerans]